MSQEQPPFGLPGPVLAGIQRRPDPGLSLVAPPLYFSWAPKKIRTGEWVVGAKNFLVAL